MTVVREAEDSSRGNWSEVPQSARRSGSGRRRCSAIVTERCGSRHQPDRGSGDPEVDEAARSAGTLGDRPLIVLTAGQYWKPVDPVAAKEIAEFHETWVHQLQPELARLSTNGKQIVVENSDHGIPEQAPDAVADAIHEVVTEVRNRQNQ